MKVVYDTSPIDVRSVVKNIIFSLTDCHDFTSGGRSLTDSIVNILQPRIDDMKKENEELKDQIKLLNELLGKTLAYTPKSFHTPILEVLNKKDKSKYEN